MEIVSQKNYIKALFLILIALLFYSCSSQDDSDEIEKGSQFVLTEIDPVDRDFFDIKNGGVLRMITYYSSNTYFLNQGMEMGFEYELMREFAREHDLALEVIIVGADENLFDLLNEGVGDVIAANYTITPERRRVVHFTRPYNLVDQLVVYSINEPYRPQTLEELSGSGIPISVRRNSSYYFRLMNLIEKGYDLEIDVISDAMDTEATLLRVARGDLRATVADDNMFHAANRYLEGLHTGPVISEADTIAWAIRSNAPDLESRMNRYLHRHFRINEEGQPRRSTFLNVLRRKYFEESRQMAEYYNPEWQYQSLGIISPYDDMVKLVTDSLDLDWLLITAMIAQESSFNPNSKSWAGAVGLMQIIPRFVETPYEELYDEMTNLRVGASIFRSHLDHYSYMDPDNQIAFALATYNVGLGHMADARRLVIDRNRDPNRWEEVSEALLMLMQRRYYEQARFGFARGIEPVRYVEEILNRYRTYQAIIALAESHQQGGFTSLSAREAITRQP